MGCETEDWMHLALDRVFVEGSCKNDIESFEFRQKWGNYWTQGGGGLQV